MSFNLGKLYQSMTDSSCYTLH